MKDYRKQKAAKLAEAEAIRGKAEADGVDLEDADFAEIEKLLDEAEDLEAKAVAQDKRKSIQDRLDKETSKPTGRAIPHDSLDVSVVADPIDIDPLCGFADFGDFCSSVKHASRPGRAVDERLIKHEAAYGANVSSGEEGGFLIPEEFSSRLMTRVINESDILSRCDLVTMTGRTLNVTSLSDYDKSDDSYRYGGVVVYYVDEASQITRSNLKFEKIKLELHKCAALSFATEEMMAEVPNFGQRLFTTMADAIRGKISYDVMWGTGAGSPQGAFNSDADIDVSAEDGQGAATVIFENVVNMLARGHGDRLEWHYNPSVFPQLATMTIDVGTGGSPVYLPGQSIAGGPPATLYGLPTYRNSNCKALGTSGDIVLADWSQYMLGMRGTAKTAMSIHIRFDYDEVAFKATFEVDGSPAWKNVLTPRHGDTLAPFVTLATRS